MPLENLWAEILSKHPSDLDFRLLYLGQEMVSNKIKIKDSKLIRLDISRFEGVSLVSGYHVGEMLA